MLVHRTQENLVGNLLQFLPGLYNHEHSRLSLSLQISHISTSALSLYKAILHPLLSKERPMVRFTSRLSPVRVRLKSVGVKYSEKTESVSYRGKEAISSFHTNFPLLQLFCVRWKRTKQKIWSIFALVITVCSCATFEINFFVLANNLHG